jgi:uncharacterized protein (TIGR02118 family)
MSKVKSLILAKRRPDLTFEQFDDHWRHPHGTLGCKIPTLRSYVQSHRLDTPYLTDDQRRYDGVAENWFDNLDEATGIGQDPTYLRYVKPDESKFADLQGGVFLYATEEVLTSGPHCYPSASDADAAWDVDKAPTYVKLLQFVQTDGNKHWASPDDKQLGQALGAFRHVRCSPIMAVHEWSPPFIGVRELFWPTVRSFEEAVSSSRDAFHALIYGPAASYTMLAVAERFK